MSQPARPTPRNEVRQLPPRRHEPICFQPLEQPEDSCALLDIVMAILAAWFIVAVVIVLVAKS